jgi:hypothetical protein
MFLFHSCNHALTPHFHRLSVLDTEQTPSVSNPLPNNSLCIWLNAKAFSLAEMQRQPTVARILHLRAIGSAAFSALSKTMAVEQSSTA